MAKHKGHAAEAKKRSGKKHSSGISDGGSPGIGHPSPPRATGQSSQPTTTTAAAPAPAPAAPTIAPVAPYLTPEQQMAFGQQEWSFDDQIAQIQQQLDTTRANTTYELTQTDKARQQSSQNAIDSSIARGLYQSSIKDGDLYDIEATARLRKDFLQTQLNLAQMAASSRIDRINQARATFEAANNQQMVQNAQTLNDQMPVAPPAPAAQTAPGSAQTPPAPAGAMPTATGSTPQAPSKPRKPSRPKHPPISDGGSPGIGHPSPTYS